MMDQSLPLTLKEPQFLMNTSVFTRETDLDRTYLMEKFVSNKLPSCLTSISVSPTDVFEVLSHLNVNKACGPDGICPRLLKEGAQELSTSLSFMFNKSLQDGVLPIDWTSANITPIFKKGDKHLVNNYRPISLTSIVCKVLEKLIHRSLYPLLESHVLHHSQFGFRHRHSTTSLLTTVVNDWAKALDNHFSVHSVFIDFAKAFDSVPHKRLLFKLEVCGISGALLKWFKSFLCDRRQRVVVNGSTSDWSPVLSGVPQGSVLGPLLFILYLNDLPKNLQCIVKMFADDVAIYKSIATREDCDLLQRDLSLISSWCQDWLMNLNPSKCEALCISNKKKLLQYVYHLCNSSLCWCTSVRYLGIPQGSALGPLLFLVYMNTLPSVVTAGTLLQYADDTTLICSGADPASTAVIMNYQLQLVHSWIADSKMRLNGNKSCVMWFKPRHCRNYRLVEQPDIMINNMTLQVTVKQKYLGLIFDKQLSWTSHVSHICKKMSYYLYLVGLHKRILPVSLIKLLMDSLVLPHMQYALPVWGPSLYQQHFLRLQRLQNRAVRLIFSLHKFDHVSNYYKQLQWFNLDQLIQFRLACMMFHQYHHSRSILLKPPIQFGNHTSHFTRTQPHFANPYRCRLSQTQKFFRCTGTTNWNNLPLNLKQTCRVILRVL